MGTAMGADALSCFLLLSCVIVSLRIYRLREIGRIRLAGGLTGCRVKIYLQ